MDESIPVEEPEPAGDMEPSKPAIVYGAVSDQLRQETRWPPDDLSRVMMTHYRYSEVTLSSFMRGVRRRLRDHRPSLVFEFDDAFVRAGLMQTVGALIASITARSNWAN